ncbi:MAG: hypothetical protein GYA17_09215 [Chloroflexi bacterium]|nr:hypothetical protein [Anaerolineaceae bacterium]NMB88528.1 hypothetical protein [Chloroflexota bacterium]
MVSKHTHRQSNLRGSTILLGGFVLFLTLILLFRGDILLILPQIPRFLVSLVVGKNYVETSDELTRAILSVIILSGTCLGSLVFHLWLVSRFVLPAQSEDDRWKVFQRFLLYIFHAHGPAIFVRDGRKRANPKELEKLLPGIALVDYNSALVLERTPVDSIKKRLSLGLLSRLLNERTGSRPVRIVNHGLAFIRPSEVIRGVVDLRPQLRVSPEVRAYTSDGIEVATRAIVIFTLGQEPDVLYVTYDGEPLASNLRVIRLEQPAASVTNGRETLLYNERTGIVQTGPGRAENFPTVTALVDELDETDRREIDRYAHGYRNVTGAAEPETQPVFDSRPYLPYRFSEKRVYAAVFSKARDTKDNVLGDWTDLVPQVAVELMRSTLAQWSYDDLYLPHEADRYPILDEVKPSFRTQLRNLGVLSYRFVRRKDGRPVEEGMLWDENMLEISPVQELRSSKLLRDRGIKLIFSTFSELRPVNEDVLKQRLENWRAHWENEDEINRAAQELELNRTRSRERAHAQRQMTRELSEIFQATSHSQEAMTMLVFQALENVATDPATRRLLPRDTIDFLRNMGNWLLGDANRLGLEEELRQVRREQRRLEEENLDSEQSSEQSPDEAPGEAGESSREA